MDEIEEFLESVENDFYANVFNCRKYFNTTFKYVDLTVLELASMLMLIILEDSRHGIGYGRPNPNIIKIVISQKIKNYHDKELSEKAMQMFEELIENSNWDEVYTVNEETGFWKTYSPDVTVKLLTYPDINLRESQFDEKYNNPNKRRSNLE